MATRRVATPAEQAKAASTVVMAVAAAIEAALT